MTDETLLNELMDELEAFRARGEAPPIERICADRPDLVDEIRMRISALREMDAMLSARDGPASAPEGGATIPPTLQPAVSSYVRLEFHARGGLGEVYRARDQRLNREVALKVIQSQRAGSSANRRRFERESEVTSRLEHPGIVPVHAAGRCDDGRPFYVMRFIDGETFEDAVLRFHEAERPGRDPGERTLAFRGLINRFVQVCLTVEYAHGRGILHRDLKPSNIMLGPNGEALVVDWGLAKVVDGADGTVGVDGATDRLEPALTAVGATFGTPAFMAPEQAGNTPDRVGPRTDVYGLGATLYHLLTGRAPSRVGTSPTSREGPGRMLRRSRVNSRRDYLAPVDAVCLKAMAMNPEDRYPTARALAEDLERWLADEPVSARQETAIERARRLARRHRTWVRASALILIISSLTLAISMAFVGAKNIALERERRRADSNAAFLLQGLTESLKRLGNPALARDPECAASARAALKEGEAIYLDLMNSERDGGSAPHSNSEFWVHVALLRTAAGDREGTIDAYHKALGDSMYGLDVHSGDPRAWAGVAGVRTHLGLELWVQGSFRESSEQLRLAAEGFRRALEMAPDDMHILRNVAWFHIFCPEPRLRNDPLALESSRRFVRQAEAEGRDRPRFSEGVRPLFTLALAQYRNEDWGAARATIEESIRRKAAKQGSATVEDLARTGTVIDAYDWFVWSMALARLDDPGQARRRFDEATLWMNRNRYGDFELRLLHSEAASLLGL